MGRPSKLDDLTAERIVRAIRKGLPWKLAAQLGGVGASTLREWRADAKAGDPEKSAFLARLKRAEAEAAEDALATIENAAREGTWQAAAWYLERRHPKQFALRKMPAAEEQPLTAEQAQRLVDEAAALKAGGT